MMMKLIFLIVTFFVYSEGIIIIKKAAGSHSKVQNHWIIDHSEKGKACILQRATYR